MLGTRDTTVGGRRARGLLSLGFLAFVALLAALVPAGAASADVVIKDPHGIACPQAPSGWFNPPGDATATSSGGRTIIAPGTVVEAGEGPQGGNTVNVSCDYFTSAGKHLVVDLLYALPTDPNPINDFYFGCRSGGTSWTDSDRVFRLMSPDQWASVAFYDFIGLLEKNDVPAFETVARQLLRNSQGYAHSCSLKVQPTPAQARLQFTFDVAAGSAEGLFFTYGTENDAVLPVVAVGVPDMTLHVRTQGKRHALTLQVTRGMTFVPAKARTKAQLKLAVRVKGSKVPGCPKGSTGTLTVSTAPSASVLLKVCSQSFLQGPAKTSIGTI
jgi:hypothetical protein